MRSVKRKSDVVGLELEAGSVHAVEVDGDRVARTAEMSLPPGLFADGEVVEPDALGERLKEFFAANGLGRRVRVGLASQRLAVRVLSLPPIPDDKELEAAARFQAAEEIPMPLEQAVLDFQRVEGVDTGDDGPRMRVVAAAARRDSVERVLRTLRAAALQPVGIDVAAFGLIRALRNGDAGGTSVLYCHFGDVTNIAIAHKGTCLFTRVLGTGLESMAQRLAERRKLTLEHARGWLTHVGLDEPIGHIDGDEEIVAEARTVLEDGAARISSELRHSIEFHGAKPGVPPVALAVGCGAGTSIPGFLFAVSSEAGLEIVTRSPKALASLGAEDATRFALSYGLALEA